jgi:hypothetical protein
MSDKVIPHPKRGLMKEANMERQIVSSPEALALQDEIDKSVRAYSDFLERHGLIWEFGRDPYPNIPRLKASALVVTLDYGEDLGSTDISLKDGALDRVYGDGVNPDPCGHDADPAVP